MFERQEPVWRRILAAILFRWHEIFRRSVDRKVAGGVTGKMLDLPRKIALGVLNDQVHVCLFVDVVKKRKRGGKDKHPDRRQSAQQGNDETNLALRRIFHGASDANRCSMIVRAPCSLIRGAAPLF